MDMLQIVIRCSMLSARMASPRYSNTWPVPPPIPISRDQREDDVLGRDAGFEAPVDADLVGLRLALEQGLGREDHLDLARPDPERERPERPVGRGVGVAAHDRHARLGEPQLRADDVDDALVVAAEAVERDPELRAVRLELLDLGGRLHGRGWEAAGVVGVEWSAVATVLSGRRTQAAVAEAGERLGAGDLVDEVEVDREDGGRVGLLGDDVVVPDLLDEGARFGHRVSAQAAVVRAHARCGSA